MECVVVQDLFLNETANYAHVFLPGSTFLEKNGTFTNAERRIQRVRKVMAPRNGKEDWEITVELSEALGYPMRYDHPSQIMDEIARLTPTFAGVSYEKLDALGSVQWPCNEKAPEGTPVMHMGGFVRGKGQFVITEYLPTDEKTGPRFPLLLTTGRILSQYNVGAQTRRTDNEVWHRGGPARNPSARRRAAWRPRGELGEAHEPGRGDDACAPPSRTGWRPAWSTPPSIIRDTKPTSSRRSIRTGRPTAQNTKSRRCRLAPRTGPTEWQESYDRQAEHSRRIATMEAAE